MTTVLECAITGVRKLKEPRCWSLGFHTQEISNEDAIKIADLNGQMVTLAISGEGIIPEVLEVIDDHKPDKKTKWSASQKLRFAIEQQATNHGLCEKDEIEEYYQAKMKTITEWINK